MCDGLFNLKSDIFRLLDQSFSEALISRPLGNGTKTLGTRLVEERGTDEVLEFFFVFLKMAESFENSFKTGRVGLLTRAK